MSDAVIRNHFAANPLLADADRAACVTDGTRSSLIVYTLDTTNISGTVPSWLHGRWVRMTPRGGALLGYQFNSHASAGVAATAPPAAAQNGATSAGGGEPVTSGVTLEIRIPIPKSGESLFFNRLGDTASTNVLLVLADGTMGTTGG